MVVEADQRHCGTSHAVASVTTVPHSHAQQQSDRSFRIMLLRWAFPVDSAMSISPAICLFSPLSTTRVRTACSRDDRASKRALSAVRASSFSRRTRSRPTPTFMAFRMLLFPEGLRQELNGARLHCRRGHRNVAISDRECAVRRREITLKIQSALPWQPYVEERTGGAVGRVGSREVGNRRKQPRIQAHGAQEPSERLAKLLIVVDDDHARI
jgi:hypothetical protein